MKYSSTINSKGQVSVPHEIRNRLGLTSGDRVDSVIEGERTVIRPSRSSSNPFEKFRGVLGTFLGGKGNQRMDRRSARGEESSSKDRRK